METKIKRRSIVYYLFGIIPIWIVKDYAENSVEENKLF